jgi:hypothetical protein
MTTTAPPIDTRTASDVTAQVKALIQAYAPAYTGDGTDPVTGELMPDPLAGALIGVFGRLTELIVQRLNQVPDKNFLAFLDLLGASQRPPQPARVPLTFSLAAGTVVPAVVPEGTQAAAPPGPGEKDPTIFETERECVVTPAMLTSAFTRDPELDSYADLSALAASAGVAAQGAPVFHGDRLLEHILYVGVRDLLGFSGISSFLLSFGLLGGGEEGPPLDDRNTDWQVWDGAAWKSPALGPAGDGTNAFRSSGSVDFGAMAPVPSTTVNGVDSRWVRCRLQTPINRSTQTRSRMVKVADLPAVRSVSATVTVNRNDLPPDAAFTNATPIDITKEFFPFGTGPHFGDTFFLRADEAFSVPGAAVTLDIVVINPAVTNPPTSGAVPNPPPTKPSADLKLSWEVWNGTTWVVLGTSMPNPPTPPPTSAPLQDGTAAFTKSGLVKFATPAVTGKTTVNGVEGHWLRVRIIAGDYGQDAHYAPVTDPKGFDLVLADFAPPIVGTATLDVAFTKAAGPDTVLTYNDFTFADVSTKHDAGDATVSFAPFVPMADERPTMYLGFELPAALTAFPNRPVSFFVRAADIRYAQRTVPIWPTRTIGAGMPGTIVTHHFTITNPESGAVRVALAPVGTSWQPPPPSLPTLDLAAGEVKDIAVSVAVPSEAPIGSSDAGLLAVLFSTNITRFDVASFVTFAGAAPEEGEPVKLVWESWNGTTWAPLTVQESTDNLSRSDTVEFLAPPDLSAHTDFGVGSRYWIRVRWDKGQYDLDPRLVRLLLNTTIAAQTVTLRNEVLGSSDGSKSLRFRSTRAPILPGQRLDVREPELPAAAERTALENEEGADAITTVLDARGRTKEILVRWHEVPDFYASGPRDRHYVIDRLSGEIRFGDGLNGLVPPIGIGNVRLTSYQTGGGSAGNRPAGSIVQLKTTVPYIDKVTNTEPAAGGADAEPVASVLDRVPREVRHGGRAVTSEDYEDLARLASPEVARAKCVPLANLVVDPLSEQAPIPGDVSVIVVPRSTEAKPLPSLELIRRVENYVEAANVPTVRVSVVGPLYIRVDVKAEAGLVSLEGATTVLADIQQRVASFLHPLTGGMDGTGWDFGRRPHESDFYALIEAVPGVDHVRSLDVVEVEDLPGVTLTGRFLVYSGTPDITAVFEEA